ncbi:MAG: hypothetical protein JXR76_23565 [Deltaproteobacteria bacterium]|nr:hypothetical protein [Deltaproteobacteria bacterium]
MKKLIPHKKHLRQSWEKYGLIVVGNIVFFALLYFISYRPHNEENRASEFLSIAQQQEAENHYHAAMVLYNKVVTDYKETRSAQTAMARIDYMKRHPPKEPPKKEPEKLTPVFDIDKMLDQQPAVYVARFLAAHYDDTPTLKPKLRQAIADYLKIAINYEGILLKTLRAEKEFQRPEFQDAFFKVKPRCQMKADWIYDDFFIKNTGIFTWHNVRVQVAVTQGDKKATADVRIPKLSAGRSFEVVSFNVDKSGGAAMCSGKVYTREGTVKFKNRI